MEHFKYVIAGAGIAGVSAIKGIREYDKSAGILLISNEDRLPYKRTQINKNIAKNFGPDSFTLYSDDWYQQQNVTLIYDKIVSVDPLMQKVCLPHADGFFYDKLLLALGSSPRIPSIQGINDDDILPVRYARQVETLMSKLGHLKRILIIGGGIEGIETAYELHKLGKQVTIIEQRANPLEKLFPPKLSEQIYTTISSSGVTYLTKTEVLWAEKNSKHHYRVTHNHGTLETDAILACTGTTPNTYIAKQAGIKVNKGILVNEYLNTSVQNIYAAGDCAENASGLVTGLWHPAEYQGLGAGKNMAGANAIYTPVPYRLKTEVFGAFFFSANFYTKPLCDKVIANLDHDNQLYELYAQNGKIAGATMSNNAELAKQLQNAIAQSWPIEKAVDLIRVSG
jgi:NAD(P)H-nitrite reductase large subunit